MELLIPGLILVALMAWASTRIKKRAADAFEAELIETESYSLRKPEGFLHVLGDPQHDFNAHTSEFSEEENSQVRRAAIEIDVVRDRSLSEVRDQIRKKAESSEIRNETEADIELVADETANQTAVSAFYKIVSGGSSIYRLRFAVVAAQKKEFLLRIEETLDSFKIKTD